MILSFKSFFDEAGRGKRVHEFYPPRIRGIAIPSWAAAFAAVQHIFNCVATY
jgi:hypothetical protein